MFIDDVKTHARNIKTKLDAAEAAHPGSAELADLHGALSDALDAMGAHVGGPIPLDGTPKS
jgi:hypothetical protein